MFALDKRLNVHAVTKLAAVPAYTDQDASTCLPANIPVTEQELPAKIALFNYIVISDGDLTLVADTKTHHRKVLDELTTKRTGTDQKHLQNRRQ